MTVRRFNSLLLLALLTVSGSSSTKVVGRAGEDVTLPCKYDITSNGPTEVFWNRVSESLLGFNHQIIYSDGYKVIETTRASSRYHLLGRLEDGDVSLTILNTTEEDAGRYGCRVETSGWLFNDEKHLIDLTIEKVSGSSSTKVVGRAGEDVTLPCKYDIKYYGPRAVCWGRGSISTYGCNNQIISTDGSKVTTGASSRYQLLGRLKDGDVSLTILNTIEEDAGLYGCRVEIPGLGNDEIHHIDLTIKKAPSTSSTPTTETTEQTPQTEQTTNTSGQVTITTSSNSINSEQQEAGGGVLVFMVRVLLAVIALVTAGVATVIGRRWNQHKIPQQQQSSTSVRFSSNSSAVELQLLQIDAGGNSDCVYEV
ncbi:T-cell immunoglobulin and mucin domain-containing protein 4-like [Scomber japonicus]|uniref:T-cell immunoglobulin and mucin domain-containing protein 4-like n=1 Tax=Scomber japonicus TaxID=13676 RepID=UPI002305E629|nr:T-cell immunoglobulin and mucin domain-containing protein 4-like [Scomber japonicus]